MTLQKMSSSPEVKPNPNKAKSLRPRISVSSCTEKFYNLLASIGCSRIYIRRSRYGKLLKEHVTSWRYLLFILLRLNLAAKGIYLFYLILVPQEGGPFDLLTFLGIGIWMALTIVAVYSDYYFAQIYPAFEVFCSFWDIQTNIYEKLSKENRDSFKKELNRASIIRTIFHTCESGGAMCAIAAQYVMDPKYITFTGALLPDSSGYVTFLFWLHEEIFMISVWYQAVAIILIPNLVSTELAICLKYLGKELEYLEENKIVPGGYYSTTKAVTQSKNNKSRQYPDKSERKYTIDEILCEYRNLEIVGDRLEDISGFILLITQIIYFALITTDVFVGIQLWRIGDTLSVAFYSVDCSTGMGYWFFSLRWMEKLDEEMQGFRAKLNSYFRLEYRKRRLHLIMWKAYREIKVMLGPTPVKIGTAGAVIYELMNYYICAAMW